MPSGRPTRPDAIGPANPPRCHRCPRALDAGELRSVFNAGFSEYLVPVDLGEEAFEEHLIHNDIDLDCSQVVLDGSPPAFALIGRGGEECWVGGIGTAPARRRRGLGKRALESALEAASNRGCRTAWLEVLVANEPAIRLYQRLGFEVVRELVAWSLTVPHGAAASGRPLEEGRARLDREAPGEPRAMAARRRDALARARGGARAVRSRHFAR
jgi:ribosomal protein S18 acetylase RimI-like enzyme